MHTVLSLFSGVGGFDLGLERAGFTVVGQAENDPKAQAVLRHHWPHVRLHNDVHDITAADHPDVDLICGGFPCQDISVAGKQKGLNNGERSVLWWEFHRIIADIRPRWVLIENVANLLGINQGRDMGAIIGSLAELGYVGEWRTLNSQGFGVPQRRRRVFIVGHLGTTSGRPILSEPEGVRGDPAPRREAGQDVAATLGGGSGSRGWAPDTDRMTFVPQHTGTITANWHKGPGNTQVDEGICVLTPDLAVRRLTPRECERLQGFPDDWTLVHDGRRLMADSHRYRFMGNAVSVPVAEWLGRRLRVEIVRAKLTS
jgi:DNA (cytosine-5)-methyltransferase 1